MAIIDKIKNLFKKDIKDNLDLISVDSIKSKFEHEDYMGAAKDLKILLEKYGRRKRKNHRYKGREFVYFILSNKHKDLKNVGYTHWENINQFIRLNQEKVYPYHKNNLQSAIDFFLKEIKGLYEIKVMAE